MKNEVKELIEDINKINVENVNLNRNYIRKENEINVSDEKRAKLSNAIDKEKDDLKKDEKSLLILNNMIEYLKKQKNKALKLKESLKNRFDVTNTDHQMLLKNIMHQQNYLNELINKRLNVEKLKNEKLVLFNSLANQSFLIDLQNNYPYINKENTPNGINGNENATNVTYGQSQKLEENNYNSVINNLHTFNNNLQKKYFTDHKGIPNKQQSEDIESSRNNFSAFENVNNGDDVDIFSSIEDTYSTVDDVEEKHEFKEI